MLELVTSTRCGGDGARPRAAGAHAPGEGARPADRAGGRRRQRSRQQRSVHMHRQGLDRWRRVRDRLLPSFLCRTTLNRATQPKPNLWSLTLTSLLWLGRPTSTPVLTPFQASEQVRHSVLWLLAAARVWTSAVGCLKQFAQHLARAPQSSIGAHSHSLLCLSASWEDKGLWAAGSAELTCCLFSARGRSSDRRAITHSSRPGADDYLALLRRLPLRFPQVLRRVERQHMQTLGLLSVWKIPCLSVPPTKHTRASAPWTIRSAPL